MQNLIFFLFLSTTTLILVAVEAVKASFAVVVPTPRSQQQQKQQKVHCLIRSTKNQQLCIKNHYGDQMNTHIGAWPSILGSRISSCSTTLIKNTVSSDAQDDDNNDEKIQKQSVPSMSTNDIVEESYNHHHHHVAIKTRNITIAIQFYDLLGYQVEVKFRAGPARAAWLVQKTNTNSRIELIEVPSYMLQEPEGMKRRAFDLMSKPELLGLNHLCLDVTSAVQQQSYEQNVNNDNNNKSDTTTTTTASVIEDNGNKYQLNDWFQDLNKKSMAMFGKTLRIALQPQQQIIGKNVYELGFLYDADGTLIELLNYQTTLSQSIGDGWEPLQQLKKQ